MQTHLFWFLYPYLRYNRMTQEEKTLTLTKAFAHSCSLLHYDLIAR